MSTTPASTQLLMVWQLHESENLTLEYENKENVFEKYISDRAYYVVIMVVMVTLSGFVSVIGMSANVINIIVFIRQGAFSDSSNVSLLALSVADFLCVLSMLWTSITYAMALNKPTNIRWEPFHILYISGAWPRVITGLITRVITAFVAFERCVCVVFPFKVKSIFTPKSSFISMVIIFTYFIICYSPVYYYKRLRYVLDASSNKTHLTLVTLSGFTEFEAIVSFINLFSINFGSVAMVLLCTMITVSSVKISSAWRESVTASGNAPNSKETKQQKTITKKGKTSLSEDVVGTKQPNKMTATKMRKEKKLIRMISSISIIFLICYIPNLVITVLYGVNDQINTKGDYKNLAWVMFSFIFLSETINSSINIVVYYRMSSRFKQECDKMCGTSGKQ